MSTGDPLDHGQDQVSSSPRKDNEDSDDTVTHSPGSSSSTSTGEHVQERKRRLSTNSEDDNHDNLEMNEELNGNDLVKGTRRSPKQTGEKRNEAKKIKLDDQTAENKNEISTKRSEEPGNDIEVEQRTTSHKRDDMEENTEEEYDDAFELGCLDMYISVYLLTTSPFTEDFKFKYRKLKVFAKKFDIELPRQIPKETTAEHEKRQFYQDQIDYVEERMMSQSQYNIEMFGCGQCIETYLLGVTILTKRSDWLEDSLKQEFIRGIEKAKRKLELIANKKHVDISEELSKVQACLEQGEQDDDIEELLQIRLQLQRKLGKRKILEEKRSEIDPSRFITNDHWTISLVRLPDKFSNEHAFLVLEGKSGNTLMIWFADFVANDTLDLLRPGVRDGKVRIDYHETNEEPGLSEKLLFRCRKDLMEIRKGDRLLHSTWEIPKPTGEVLVRNLETLQANPPKYNILGNTMLAGSSARSSSKSTGHNCFTFAKMVLHCLPDDYIEIPENKLDTWIYSATSRYLVDNQPNNQRLDMLGFRGIFMFVAGVVTAVFLFKLFNS